MAKKKKRERTSATGFVKFESLDGKLEVTTLLGDGPGTPTGGFGGWEIRPRARRRAFVIWTGNDPLQIDIPIIIDHWAEGKDVDGGARGEKDIRQLEIMAGLQNGMREPPLISFDAGGAVPHDASDDPNKVWVIGDIEWGDCEKTVYGNRYRQAAVVKVIQFIEDDNLQDASAAQKRKNRKKDKYRDNKGHKRHGAKHKRYVVKKHDTLRKIAKNELHDAKRWHEIADLNSIRDGTKLKVGQALRLP